jgi:HEAT repeat protein
MLRLAVVAACGAFLLGAANAQEADDAVAARITQLGSEDPLTRQRAAKELGRLGGDEAAKALGRALLDRSEAVQHEAAIALARLDPTNPKVVEVLIRSLRHKDWYVRWQACLGLQAHGPKAAPAVPALLHALRDTELGVSRVAVLALAKIAPRDERVIRGLLEALGAEHPVDCGAVVFALERARKAHLAIPWLAREVNTDQHNFSVQARGLLRRIAPAHAISFIRVFDPHDAYRRSWAASDFQEAGGAAVPTLVVALGDEAARVRMSGIRALAEIGTDARPALPHIVRALGATLESERYAAHLALYDIAPSLAYATRMSLHADGGQPRLVFEPPGLSLREKRGLLALLTDKEVGDATLTALAAVLGRPKKEVLEEVRQAAAAEASPR